MDLFKANDVRLLVYVDGSFLKFRSHIASSGDVSCTIDLPQQCRPVTQSRRPHEPGHTTDILADRQRKRTYEDAPSFSIGRRLSLQTVRDSYNVNPANYRTGEGRGACSQQQQKEEVLSSIVLSRWGALPSNHAGAHQRSSRRAKISGFEIVLLAAAAAAAAAAATTAAAGSNVLVDRHPQS